MRTWSLVRIFYTEVLDRAEANPSPRTSYCLVPSTWRASKPEELETRIKNVLQTAYAEINLQESMTEDPAGFAFVDCDFEWVSEAELATKPWRKADPSPHNGLFYVDEAGEVHFANHLYNPYGYFEERLL
jgi:hypothetical protein